MILAHNMIIEKTETVIDAADWPDNYLRRHFCLADDIRAGLQHRELAVYVGVHQDDPLAGLLQRGVIDDRLGAGRRFYNGHVHH